MVSNNAVSATLDADFVRGQFPAFSHPETSRWAHLENAGGSYVPRQVIDRFTDLLSFHKTQPNWDFAPSQMATAAIEQSRIAMAATFNADSDEIHFGPSTTQNTYVLSRSMRHGWVDGDEIIVTNQDHEANIGAWRSLAEAGVVVREWSVDPATGLLDIADLEPLINERTRLVAVTHASNVAATINPVRRVADLVHAVGGVVVVDGVSYAPHAPIDVRELDCDIYLYSAYKTFGPHLGMMYTRRSLLESLHHEGHWFNESSLSTRLTPAGPDHVEIGASGGIVDYYEEIHRHHFGEEHSGSDLVGRIREVFSLFTAHEQKLMTPLVEFLTNRDGLTIVGSESTDHSVRAPTVAFHSDNVSSANIYRALIDAGISCGHGHFYARRLVEALGLDPEDGVVRLSLVHYNTPADITRAISTLNQIL